MPGCTWPARGNSYLPKAVCRTQSACGPWILGVLHPLLRFHPVKSQSAFSLFLLSIPMFLLLPFPSPEFSRSTSSRPFVQVSCTRDTHTRKEQRSNQGRLPSDSFSPAQLGSCPTAPPSGPRKTQAHMVQSSTRRSTQDERPARWSHRFSLSLLRHETGYRKHPSGTSLLSLQSSKVVREKRAPLRTALFDSRRGAHCNLVPPRNISGTTTHTFSQRPDQKL